MSTSQRDRESGAGLGALLKSWVRRTPPANITHDEHAHEHHEPPPRTAHPQAFHSPPGQAPKSPTNTLRAFMGALMHKAEPANIVPRHEHAHASPGTAEVGTQATAQEPSYQERAAAGCGETAIAEGASTSTGRT